MNSIRNFFLCFVFLIASNVLWAGNTISYTASNKLSEVHLDKECGLHVHSFNVPIISHTFLDGEGLITFSGDLSIIGVYAFKGSSNLFSIVIPDRIIAIDAWAFEDCSNLAHVNIPNSVSKMGYGVFQNCNNLPHKYYFDKENQKVSAAIYADTYLVSVWNCPKTFTIEPETRWIGSNAFCMSKELENIEIPNSVVEIGADAFYGCDNLPIVDGIRYAGNYLVGPIDDTKETYVIRPGTKWIGYKAFSECMNLKHIEIPHSVISIESRAFEYCTNLKEIILPNSIERIKSEAFLECFRLKKIILPENITTIEYEAFMRCSGLRHIKIPQSVVRIEDMAFAECWHLQSLKLPKGCLRISSEAFSECRELKSVKFNKGLRSIGIGAFNGCEHLRTIVIPDSVRNIPDYVFCGSGIRTVFIPESIVSIGRSAFAGCEKLQEICCSRETPPIVKDNTFDGVWGVKIYVPSGTEDIYKAANGWDEFTSYEPIPIKYKRFCKKRNKIK